MTCRRLAALMFVLLVPSSAIGQDGKRTELTFQIGALANLPTWRVATAEPSGEITLKYEGFGDATLSALEGYFLLVPIGADARSVARVLVTDVDTTTATMKTSPEAAKAFPPGTGVRLVRPFPATTKQLKSIPEHIVLGAEDNAQGGAMKAARDAASRARSINNLKQIGLGMHNYMSANDHLPPAVARGPDGKPWHSWRVLLLPYIEEAALFKEYDFAQPWDSEKNLKLLDKMPAVYRDPIYGDDKGHFTNYAVLVGVETAFPPAGLTMVKGNPQTLDFGRKPAGAIRIADITDGLSNTLAAAPVSPDRKIPWTKPEDIEFKQDVRVGKPPGDLFVKIGEPAGIAAPYELNGEKVAPVLLLDGWAKLLSARTNKIVLSALITKSGGEIVQADVFAPPAIGPARPGVATIFLVIENGMATATIR